MEWKAKDRVLQWTKVANETTRTQNSPKEAVYRLKYHQIDRKHTSNSQLVSPECFGTPEPSQSCGHIRQGKWSPPGNSSLVWKSIARHSGNLMMVIF